jgi:HEAT repeat protein
VLALDAVRQLVKIPGMPRSRFNFPLLLTALFVLAACDRPVPSASTRGPITLATNAMALAAALRDRDPEIRAVSAQLIAANSIAVDQNLLIRGLDDSDPNVRRHCAVALGRMRANAAIKPLFMLLQDDNWFVRAEAAAALGQIGDPRAAGWLVQLLNDQDPYVRLCAGTALREVAADSHRSMLLQAYVRATPTARVNLAIALAKLQEPIAVDPLISATQTNDVTLRRRVAEALGDYPPAAVSNTLTLLSADPNASVRDEAMRALQRMGNTPATTQ